jgi:type I restriction enzyme M protein
MAAFPDGHYWDVLGLCKAVTQDEIAMQDGSLDPGRYVGVAAGEVHDAEKFKEKLEELREELEALNTQATHLQSQIAQNVAELLAQ